MASGYLQRLNHIGKAKSDIHDSWLLLGIENAGNDALYFIITMIWHKRYKECSIWRLSGMGF